MKPPISHSRIAFICIAVLFAGSQFSCRDSPTAPKSIMHAQVSEAINAPGDSGAPEVIFLAPLGPKKHPRGVLDTTLAPSVSICRLAGDSCGPDTLAHFSSDSSADSTRRVDMNERAYFVRWKLKDLPADPSITYRAVVTLGDTTVGYTDLKIVAPDYQALPDDTLKFAFITERNKLNVRFQIFVPPVTLTVIAEPGVHGDLSSQTYTVRRGDKVSYNFAADSSYKNVLVTLDQAPIAKHGRVTMDDSHVLIASADRGTGVAPGDEWILKDARALLKAADKVKAAQQLLTRLDEMRDTTGIAERLRRVEMTFLERDADAGALAALDAAFADHQFDAGAGDGARDDTTIGGGGGVATALLVPLGVSAQPGLRQAASVMTQGRTAAEPVTIAYVNGILTTPLGALFAAHHVAAAAREAHWNSNVPFDVKLMYNRSAMASESSTEDRCILELGIKGDWLGLNSLPGEIAKCLGSTEPSALALLADYAEVGQQFSNVLNRSIITRPPDVDSIAAFTTRLRDAGRHVVFVMHSQGNLMVQQALTLLAKRGKYVQARDTTCIGGVALASPTSEAWPIAPRHLHGLAVDGDAILTLGHNNFPRVRTPLSDSAAHETTGPLRARIAALASGASIRWGLRLHSIVESYLGQEPMRSRIEDAIVASYRGCAVGTVEAVPHTMTLHAGESGTFRVSLLDLEGMTLDGQRGIMWSAESQTDWQRAVQFAATGTATARYVGGTSVSVLTRSVAGDAGVTVDPAPISVSATESLSARWVLLWMSESDQVPIPPFVVPGASWDGGDCAENTMFSSNGRTGTFSKECTADYHVKTEPFPEADKYVATFFEKGAKAARFSASGSSASLRGTVGGPAPNLDLLPGPIPMDRISVTAFDVAGHLLASGTTCVHGCIGWPSQ
jgi:hypothetical protein